MAVWTRGSAGRRSATWIWVKGLLSPRTASATRSSDDVPEDLRPDLALSRPMPAPEEDLWTRIRAARLPPL